MPPAHRVGGVGSGGSDLGLRLVVAPRPEQGSAGKRPSPRRCGRYAPRVSDLDYRATVRELSERLVAAQRRIRILDAVAWDDRVRGSFFASDCQEPPAVDRAYYEGRPLGFDVAEARETFEALERDIAARLGGFNPAGRIMTRMCREYETVLAMLEARGTPDFARYSAELYGRSTDALHAGQASLADLAAQLEGALRNIDEHAFLEQATRDIPTGVAVERLQARLDREFAGHDLHVNVRADDGIIADAAAGSDYIKLRADALFSERDLRALEVHEGWVHVGTTLNGRSQPVCTFLGKGTPATAITQEGLALLVEVVSFASHPKRLRRVTDRIRVIHMAEQGADFLETFRALTNEGRSREEAWGTCARVFRGSTPGLGPFTKDLAYSKGFVLVYNFIRLAVRRGRIDRIPLLFVGKVVLEELGAIADLMEEGVVAPPRFLPPPFRDLSALTAWMAYSNFLNRLDLDRVEADFAALLD